MNFKNWQEIELYFEEIKEDGFFVEATFEGREPRCYFICRYRESIGIQNVLYVFDQVHYNKTTNQVDTFQCGPCSEIFKEGAIGIQLLKEEDVVLKIAGAEEFKKHKRKAFLIEEIKNAHLENFNEDELATILLNVCDNCISNENQTDIVEVENVSDIKKILDDRFGILS